ncbi:MAG: hypothetical protein IJP13_03735 [Lachnospiraceae bacterium]|nr:hypothetical protein [Lachnospiraceae bacterium]
MDNDLNIKQYDSTEPINTQARKLSGLAVGALVAVGILSAIIIAIILILVFKEPEIAGRWKTDDSLITIEYVLNEDGTGIVYISMEGERATDFQIAWTYDEEDKVLTLMTELYDEVSSSDYEVLELSRNKMILSQDGVLTTLHRVN